MDLGISPDLDRPVAGRCDPRIDLPPNKNQSVQPDTLRPGADHMRA